MVEFTITGEELWNRMERAVEKVNERLRKTVKILEVSRAATASTGGAIKRSQRITQRINGGTFLE
ncbi:hypothetical protein SH449x_004048 [Pirellulaceae bacterium SH449]